MGFSYNSQGKRWERRTKGFRQYVDHSKRVWGRVRSLEGNQGIIGFEAEVYLYGGCGGGTRTVKSTFKFGSLGVTNKRDAELMAMRYVRDHVQNDRNARAL